MIQVLGGVAAFFALALLVLPAARVAQGAIPLRNALGLWVSAVGFGLLAAAALLLSGPAANRAVLAGVVVAVVGSVIQRRSTR
jgi:hypothetical protein